MDKIKYKYDIFDNNGVMYSTWVTKREAEVYDLNHLKRHRLLNDLKARSTCHQQRWDESLPDTTVLEPSLWQPAASPGVSGNSVKGPLATSSPQPQRGDPHHDGNCMQGPINPEPQTEVCFSEPRAEGKTGGKWTKESTHTFLKVCMHYQSVFASGGTVPQNVYEGISDKLYLEHVMNYSWMQLREKMRNLKRTYREALGGKHLGIYWEYFADMVVLLKKPLDACKTVSEARTSPEVSGNATYVIATDKHPVGDFEQQPKGASNTGSDAGNSPLVSGNATYDVDCDNRYLGAVPKKPQVASQIGREPVVSPVATDKAEYVVGMDNLQLDDNGLCDVSLNHTVINNQKSNTDVIDDFVVDDNNFDGNNNINNEILDKSDPSFEMRSPSRKKNKQNGSCSASQRTTPKKTPKRKCNQTELIWHTDELALLFEEGLKQKEALQNDPVPPHIWKDISWELEKKGHRKSWDICRDKFLSFKKFFMGSLLPKKGILGGVKCPHFDILCDIFDIQVDLEPDISNVLPDGDGNRIWHQRATTLFLELYQEKQWFFEGTNSYLTRDELFNGIAKNMEDFGITVTGKQCKDHLAVLKSTLREEFCKTNKTGSAPSQWPFYDKMLDLFKDSPFLSAPVAVSVGTKQAHTEKGVPITDKDRETRTRPPCTGDGKSSSTKSKSVRRKIYLSQQDDAMAKNLKAKEDIVKEIQLMRGDSAQRSTERMAVLNNIVSLLQGKIQKN